MNTQPDSDRCTQLRKLHARLTNEVKLLRESIKKAEQNGVDTSIEALQQIKHLQASLRTISVELEKCPPDSSEVVLAASQPVKAIRGEAHWFPESQDPDSDDEFESVLDES